MIYEAMIEGWVIPASLMIAAVLAIRFVLRGKISLRLQYALWAVVLVRLLVPCLLFVSPISADPVTEKLEVPEAIHHKKRWRHQSLCGREEGVFDFRP